MPTYDTAEPISITVELGIGVLRIEAGDRADTVVEVEPGDPGDPSDVAAAAKTTVEYANSALRIKAPKGWRRYGLHGGAEFIDVRIQVPTGSHLSGKAGLADLRISGALGECRYKTGAGDITVERIDGDGELTTGSGAVVVERIGGAATVKNGNGETWIGEAGGGLLVKAANGKIAVDHAHTTVTAKTANGDIHLDEVFGDAVVAETGCGKVDIGVHSGVAAWLDLHTGFGHVRNRLDVGERPGSSEPTVEVWARSGCGDISIRRAEVGSGQGAA
jgi:hypothetical protein